MASILIHMTAVISCAWRLLVQLDSDGNAARRWADAGMLYFWIERAALATRRFANMWVVLQSD
jgi:uncharacterized protein YwqG